MDGIIQMTRLERAPTATQLLTRMDRLFRDVIGDHGHAMSAAVGRVICRVDK